MAWVTKSSQETYVNNETPREYTKTEKAGNWWHYHKWQVVAVIVALVLVASFIKETVFSTKPDYQVAFVGIQNLPDDTVSALTEALQSFGEDLNGDGQVSVLVNQYVLDMDKLSDTTEVDPYMQMAGLTRLSADISSRDGSFIYLLEDQALFESYTEALSYLDGTIPADTDDSASLDWTRMVYRWTDCPVLTGLDLGSYTGYTSVDEAQGSNQDVLKNLYLGFRGDWSGEENPTRDGAWQLWQKLTAGAESTASES